MVKRKSFIIEGTTLIGIGIGFIFLKNSPYYFLASVLIGAGTGFLIEHFFSKKA
ncbi:multidrug transporter [Thermosipho ferrireducens]|uniref:Multidrug transporter n=1 Tax=Thermosipho ferrireducens TaxID=2571116 RepID=A0ABX7S683_9BACT|nr:multidrug transporter [Thermosipho ferrireducens]QTA37694.1 multidrug transporter [Thermosipho ferrireducens]